MSFLQVSGISKSNERGIVLDNVSFSQERLHKLAIAGETGSGKSTLLRIITGHVQKDSGNVLFEGKKVEGPEEKLIPGRPGVAYLSQQYELRNHYRVEELMDMASNLTNEAAATLYDLCRISHLLKRRTDQLSGGEKQRIALARLLTTSPRLLVLDEPFSNLDLIHKNILKAVLKDIGDTLQTTFILTSHDPFDTLSWAEELLVMKEGVIVQQGNPKDIYQHPVSEYVAGIFGNYNLISAALANAFNIMPAAKPAPYYMIRPEQFKIVPGATANAVQATVRSVMFSGSYYDLTAAIAGTIIQIKTSDGSLSPGDSIYLLLPAGAAWQF